MFRWMSAITIGWLLLGAFFLIGCTTVPCDTCIGPYDLLLSSHREGLGL